MKIRPLGDRVLVEPIEENEKVISVGKKTDKETGKEIPFDVKAGDTVLLPKYGGTEVKLDGKKLQLVREEDLLGVIEK